MRGDLGVAGRRGKATQVWDPCSGATAPDSGGRTRGTGPAGVTRAESRCGCGFGPGYPGVSSLSWIRRGQVERFVASPPRPSVLADDDRASLRGVRVVGLVAVVADRDRAASAAAVAARCDVAF